MTNDEINRRMAEIEMPLFPGTWKRNSPPPYTTDWQWCGPLLKRDIIRLEWDTAKPSRKWMAMAKHGVLVIGNDTPHRAICLAVIAAHKPAILQSHETLPPGPGCPPARPDVAD